MREELLSLAKRFERYGLQILEGALLTGNAIAARRGIEFLNIGFEVRMIGEGEPRARAEGGE